MHAQKDASNAHNTYYYYTQTIQISTITSSNYSPRSIPFHRTQEYLPRKKKKRKRNAFKKIIFKIRYFWYLRNTF